MKDINILSGASDKEKNLRAEYLDLYAQNPISNAEIIQNMGLFTNRMNLSRILFMQELYLKIINVHGIVVEFGVRWGQNLALYSNFRGIYEPFNL